MKSFITLALLTFVTFTAALPLGGTDGVPGAGAKSLASGATDDAGKVTGNNIGDLAGAANGAGDALGPNGTNGALNGAGEGTLNNVGKATGQTKNEGHLGNLSAGGVPFKFGRDHVQGIALYILY
ncbi:hypothetical protein NP233_g1814 [Leucocoprinus birnbaumii]|uniref:Uncharacterized protein n=1 Tax=Leucocoprinus birnbaumii TaxID=56174 RepID=A0AAD5W3A3_9AGAR|nr:hypothetical protein NP233_g1814 [Leucocoprinus birnbaumii]